VRSLVIELLKALPEWMIFGTWDTKRCPVCKGWKKREGHKKNCPRIRLEDEIRKSDQVGH
jgi:hypothetical protein